MTVFVIYRDGSTEEHYFNADTKGQARAREFARTSAQQPTVVKAVVKETE
jgi:hypothetical protein